jgi:nucleoid-associated protein YgaU
LLYEDQLKNSVGALHHFQRYLELSPEGQYVNDVKNYTKRIELVMSSRLGDGAVLPVTEATRLKNENQALRQELTELKKRGAAPQRSAGTPSAAMAVAPLATPAPVFPPPLPPAAVPAADAPPEVRRAVPVNAAASPAATPSGPRSYVVQKGDTLAGISRKFYKSANQWQKIAEANKDILPDPTKLKIGTELKIPE